ncbi:MAG: hypothetical protein M3458_09145 [Acidobacteriota bacterium]|nr:hypothetical protein [Acidobacteriota bacterium]
MNSTRRVPVRIDGVSKCLMQFAYRWREVLSRPSGDRSYGGDASHRRRLILPGDDTSSTTDPA